jgi:hypothetical protein
MKTHYTVWSMDEEVNLAKAIVARWREAGYTIVHHDHYREVIEEAAAGTAPENERHIGWRPRTLKSRDARRFIQVRFSTLEKLMDEGRVLTYTIPGYDDRLTAEQMQDEIVRLRAEVKNLREELTRKNTPPPSPEGPVMHKPIVTRPKPHDPCAFAPSLPQKLRVAIAGVHDKHRDAIAKAFPNLNIAWIEPRDNDSLIKAKASGRPAIACTHGTNSKVLKLLNNVCTKFFTVGGAHGVKATLASAQLDR